MNFLGLMIIGVLCISFVVLYCRAKNTQLKDLQLWLIMNEGLESDSRLISGPFNVGTLMEMQESIRRRLETKYSFIDAQCIVAIGKDRNNKFYIYWTAYRQLPGTQAIELTSQIKSSLLHYIFKDKGLYRIVKPTSSLSMYQNQAMV